MVGTLNGRSRRVMCHNFRCFSYPLTFARQNRRYRLRQTQKCRTGATMRVMSHKVGILTQAWTRLRATLSLLGLTALLAACSTQLGGGGPPIAKNPGEATAANAAVGEGQVRVALILPLSGQGNASVAGQSMKNAAEMALAEFKSPNIQLLVKDDGGTVQGAQSGAQQAISEGAEIIIGPLFAQSVSAVGQVARANNIPVIAFSTDVSVAARGVYLLSFLPETDVRRIVDFSTSRGKRSFAAILTDNAYGTVVEGAFQQEVSRRGGRVVVLEKYTPEGNRINEAARRVSQAANQVDSIFIPDSPDAVPQVVNALASNGVDLRRVQMIGSGLWEDARISSTAALDGAWYAAPEATGYRNFSARYRARYGQDPVRTATLAYDAVALVAALVKTQGPQRFSEQALTNPSGFAGIDGVFRFRPEGTNDRGLAVLRVAPAGGQVLSPAPNSFQPGT